MGRINRKQAEFILGEVTIPCVTMVNEVIGMTVQGTQLLINTYFGDLSDVEIPQKYYFEMCGKQDPKNGLIQKEPELSPADFKRFDEFLSKARNYNEK